MRHIRAPILVVVLSALLAGMSTGCAPGQDGSPDNELAAATTQPAVPEQHAGAGRVYDPENHFSVIPPENWSLAAEARPGHFLTFYGPAGETFSPNLNVTRIKDDGTPIERVSGRVRFFMALLHEQYKMVESGWTVLNGLKVFTASATFAWDGQTVRNLQYFVRPGNGKVFVLTYHCLPGDFAEYREKFQASAQSVRVD